MPSKSELRALGERKGWSVRDISMREINAMSADETLWHEAFNVTNWRAAFEREDAVRQNKQHMKVWDVRRAWRGQATEEEDRLARIAGEQFAMRHPQFARTIENATRMIEHMKSRDLDATQISSYTTAFLELTEQGKLTVAPAESADEFLRTHPELHDRRTPPIIAARNAKAQATAEHFEKTREATATARAGATRVTDYGREQQGVPPYSDIEKTSLRNLARKMNAAELQAKCESDPSFRKALDEL